jgi:hypothetical protein
METLRQLIPSVNSLVVFEAAGRLGASAPPRANWA